MVKKVTVRTLKKLKENNEKFAVLTAYDYSTAKYLDEALSEAKRVCKDNGYIITSYYMNEYAIITYGFMKNNIREALNNNQIDEDFHMLNLEDDLYSMVRLEDIDSFNDKLDLERFKIIASDGPSNYIRPYLNKLSDDDYKLFIEYQLKMCERKDLIGASTHLVDIVKVKKAQS